ncbi:hypothetical protein Tco_1412776 [Tanacetum coccineum]
MVPPNNLGPDLSGKAVNKTQYRGMIGSLMYLTASRPDIQFSTCLCARYQANSKESHLIAVKRIFRYLKGTLSLSLWYLKCLGFDLKGYSDSDYAGCNMDRKITSESSSHNPSSPKITLKEEPVTLDKLESPNPFLPITQVEFTFEEITFTTNNEVALLYPSHPNQKYFKDVSDFISKCCLKEAFTKSTTQYKEYLSEFWYTTKTLEDSKVWVSTPTSGVRGDIGYNREIGAKGTLKKSCLPPKWRLLMGQIIQCLSGKTGGLDQISNKDATILYCLANGVQVDGRI